MDDQTLDDCEVIPFCAVCGGRMEVVYDRPNAKVCVCVDCHTGLTVPSSAWRIARTKRADAAQTQSAADRG